MISIVTAYYNRKTLFKRTLESIKNQHCSALLEVIAVDDGSDEVERLEDLCKEFSFLKVIRLERKNKWYNNSCIPFNIGFKAAKGDKIIIQNPECLHLGHILDLTENTLTDNHYLSFACFSLDKYSTDHLDSFFKDPLKIGAIIRKDGEVGIVEEGQAGWYNHSVYRPVGYHFCAAITKQDLKKLRGFDELYALGIAYDDVELIWRIKKMGIQICFIDNEIVLHQNHYSPTATSYHNRNDRMQLTEKNGHIYESITKSNAYSANKYINIVPINFKKKFLELYTAYWDKKLALKRLIGCNRYVQALMR